MQVLGKAAEEARTVPRNRKMRAPLLVRRSALPDTLAPIADPAASVTSPPAISFGRVRSARGRNKANGYRDGKRVLECLQRALKIADVCMQVEPARASGRPLHYSTLSLPPALFRA